MNAWSEVADGVFQRRYNPLDISICAVRADDGLMVVDTRSSPREAKELIADLRPFGAQVRWVVNTHAHFDHTFGNQCFGPESDIDAPIYGHQRVPAHLEKYEVAMLARFIEQDVDREDGWDQVVITPPTKLVGERTSLDVGGREVQLVHLGRGHTDNDLLVQVPDAMCWLVGDVIEESGPPMYGSGSFPLEWPGTVAAMLDELEDGDTLVPGHGAVVDRAFAAAQQQDLQTVADLVRELHAADVPVERAVAAGGDRWPFPAAGMRAAVVDGYRHLAAAGITGRGGLPESG
jgi:glyoxylase-like metal-dependent hydrolase (beta-lactamase superfamily II)